MLYMEWYSQLSETCTNIWRAVAGKIYVVGGYRRYGVPLRSAEVYDPRTNQWTMISDMRVGRLCLSCIAFHGYVYAIGKNKW
jgi:kelch-like protein 10